jgi:hypothetical protein
VFRLLFNPLFEHAFWLQILGDHARFIFNALSPTEGKEIQRARYFINTFDSLLNQARQKLQPEGIETLNRQAYQQVKELKRFKLHLLRRHLNEMIATSLPPTFFNHMVNELEEYESILAALVQGQPSPSPHPIHDHLLWLTDGAFHAVAIMNALDGTEKDLLKRSNNFRKNFESLYLKSLEIRGYLRTGLQSFPAFSRFNLQVEVEMQGFISFLRELEEEKFNKTILGSLNPLMADHMAREECYYLTKLAQGTNIKNPNCDPTKPRNIEKI